MQWSSAGMRCRCTLRSIDMASAVQSGLSCSREHHNAGFFASTCGRGQEAQQLCLYKALQGGRLKMFVQLYTCLSYMAMYLL